MIEMIFKYSAISLGEKMWAWKGEYLSMKKQNLKIKLQVIVLISYVRELFQNSIFI